MVEPGESGSGDDGGEDAPATRVRWATHTEPDFLALQLDGSASGLPGSRDAMRALLQLRGFTVLPASDELALTAASGCSLTRTGPTSAELLVRVSARVGATSVPLVGLDPTWLTTAVVAGQAAVLLTTTAVAADGTTSRDALRRDVEAGGVLAALVATADLPG